MSRDEKLIFPPETTSAGFATADTDYDRGNPEPVVRELLQNSLDARLIGGSEVIFTINDDLPLSLIPGLDYYRETFREAIKQREGRAGPVEENICRRIDKALRKQKISVLFCRDNGRGLNEDSMSDLLAEGNTSKINGGGAGAIGLGHLTAFAASDLRYVIYGGKTGQDKGIYSGRAHLAARHSGGHNLSPKGTLASSLQPQSQLFGSPFLYYSDPPQIMASQMEQVDNSGAVIAILGFNYFGLTTSEEVAERLLKIAATHFMPAIYRETMAVSIKGDVVNKGTLKGFISQNGKLNRTGGIMLPEGIAARSYNTLLQGESLETNLPGVELLFRQLEDGERYTRVNLYREGMWITWSAPYLQPDKFGKCAPFDAIIMSNNQPEDNGFYRLVRAAEGPSHTEVRPDNLADREDRKMLGKMLKQISGLLRERAEKPQQSRFIPANFAIYGQGVKAQAEEIKRRPRARRPATAEHREGQGRESTEGNGKGGSKKKERKQGRNEPASRPKSGRSTEIPMSVKEVVEGGMIIGFEVHLSQHKHRRLGVRVITETASDETCDQMLSSDFHKLTASKEQKQEGEYEIILESTTSGQIDVELKDPVPVEAGLLKIDLVPRR